MGAQVSERAFAIRIDPNNPPSTCDLGPVHPLRPKELRQYTEAEIADRYLKLDKRRRAKFVKAKDRGMPCGSEWQNLLSCFIEKGWHESFCEEQVMEHEQCLKAEQKSRGSNAKSLNFHIRRLTRMATGRL